MVEMTEIEIEPASELELVLARQIALPPEALFRAWSDPALVKQWWCPKPWTTPEVDMDLRAGGKFRTVMLGPTGERHELQGVFLEVVPDRRVVWTDAFRDAWTPAPQPFMVGAISFEPADGGTRYVARAGHWTAADRDRHAEMGFHGGWGKVAEQLAEVALRL